VLLCFIGQKTHFRAGRHEKKEQRRFYLGLKILDNPKYPKIDFPYYSKVGQFLQKKLFWLLVPLESIHFM
jgi:hypothetical protein